MGTSWIEVIYWVSTITGGTLFILRTVLLLFGGGLGDHTLDAGLDIPHSTDFDLSGDIHTDIHMDIEADHAEAYASFKLLSLQGLTAFFMMFGLVGLALTKANLPVLVTVLGAGAAGLITVSIVSVLFSQMKRLQSDGTIRISNAIGEAGTVYLTIPPKGSGQVQVVVQGTLKIFDAISSKKTRLATGDKVKIIDVADGNTLIVEKVQNL